jgi:alkylation response protein AidB-like acyl-CoA dehydrogenase
VGVDELFDVGQAYRRKVALRRSPFGDLSNDRMSMTIPLKLATQVDNASRLLKANAEKSDVASSIPADHFDSLADCGLYGAFAPSSINGLELDLDQLCTVVEQLAAACLTTTFVWIQHFRLLAALLDPATPEEIRALLPLAVSGQLKGGVALGGLLPGPPRLRAIETKDGWRIDGEAPWVSGWGIVDAIFLTARHSDDAVTSFVIDATVQAGLEVTHHRLSAMNASSTVRLIFTDFYVPDNRYVGSQPYEPGLERPEGLRVNGSLALGVARRCCELLGPTSLDDELRRCRDDLDAYETKDIYVSRARAAELAVRAAHILSVSRGSQSAISGDVAERTSREAALLLVFASRPAIKEALLNLMIDGN